MGYAIKIYEAFKDDEEKAKLLAEFIEMVEEAISNNQLATRQDLTVTELKLIKEIELLRSEMKDTELKLTKEIELVRKDLTVEIYKSKVSTIRWIVSLFLTQTITIIGVLAGFLKLMIK